MEWFDFALYSYLAVIISKNFFSPVQNDELSLSKKAIANVAKVNINFNSSF
jgi:hypothetical protein